MASEKNSRLVNLVIALLATRRYLTKAQIFRAVSGYEGNQEANDRMFERDKEELRALGIEVSVKNIDPLFDDEIGYRIFPDNYSLDLGQLTSEEIALLALAAESWKESALRDIAQATSIRLESLGVVSDFSNLPLAPKVLNAPILLPTILQYAEQDRIIEFQYLNLQDESESKKVAPYGVYSRGVHWYLYAKDSTNGEMRNFRLDRILEPIKQSSKKFERGEFKFPERYFEEIEVELEIRRDFAPEILQRATVISEGEEWINCKATFPSENVAISSIFRNCGDVKV